MDETKNTDSESESPAENEVITGCIDEAIPVFKKGDIQIDRVEFLDKNLQAKTIFYTNDALHLRVYYHTEKDSLGQSIGLAVAIERESDLVLITNFSTCNVVDDAELLTYRDIPYRQTKALKNGYIEAVIIPLQLLQGQYLVSLGLIPNNPLEAEFYEYHHRRYRLTVSRSGFPSGALYYPILNWNHEEIDYA